MKVRNAIKKTAYLLAAVVITTAVLYSPEKEEVTYHVPVEQGDTIYGIASRMAGPEENINRLAWRIRRDNHIEDVGAIQPGTELIVTVERQRGETT